MKSKCWTRFLPHSLGSFYTMICEFIGYKKYGDEGKVMGWRPTGRNLLRSSARDLIDSRIRRFQLDLNYFKPLGSNQGMQIKPTERCALARHFSDRMEKFFGRRASRTPRYAARHGPRLRHAASFRRSLLSSAE